MGPHELIYKLVGNDGTILEICADPAIDSRWKQIACDALPLLTWEHVDIEDVGEKGSIAQVLWVDAGSLPDDQNARVLQKFGETGASELVAILKQDESEITKFLNSLSSNSLYAKAITAIGSGEESACAIIAKRYDAASDTIRHCRALSELAVTRYLETTPERIELRKLLEQRQSHRLQLENESSLARQWQAKAETLLARVQELAHALDEKEQSFAQLEKQASLAQRQLLAHEKRVSELQRSFSYRFGNLFAMAGRNPKDLILLPVHAAHLLLAGALNRIKRIQRARGQATSPQAIAAAVRAANIAQNAAIDSPRFDAELQDLMRPQVDDDAKGGIATILHPLTASLLASECDDLVAVHPNTWKADMESADVLVVDAYMLLAFTPWQHTLAGSPLAYPGHLLDLLEYCRATRIPSVLLLTCTPDDRAILMDMLPLFSHVIAPANVDLGNLPGTLTGRTTIGRSGWPVANDGNIKALSRERTFSPAVLSVSEGQILVRRSKADTPQLLYTVTDGAQMDDVFGRPLILEKGRPLDLRILELVSKGAVPVLADDGTFADIPHYRFEVAEAVSPWELMADETRCHDIAHHNVIAAATFDSVKRVTHTLMQLTNGETRQLVDGRLSALVVLKETAHIPMLAATFKRQFQLPQNVVLFPDSSLRTDDLMHSLAGQMPADITVQIAEGRVADYVRRNPGDSDSWRALMHAECHYGNDYFVHARALSMAGTATAFAQMDGAHIDLATLVFSSERSEDIAQLLLQASQQTAQVTPPPGFQLVPIQVDFQRLNNVPQETHTV